MATYNPIKKKWVAKRKRGSKSYHLGYFEHPLFAVVEEIWFDLHIPRAYKNNNPTGQGGDRSLVTWRKSFK